MKPAPTPANDTSPAGSAGKAAADAEGEREEETLDFVLCVGNLMLRDEDLIGNLYEKDAAEVPYVDYLPPHDHIFTCKVGDSGRNVSQARHFVDDGAGAAMVLASLAALSQQLPPEASPEEGPDHPAAEGPAEVESALLEPAPEREREP